MCGTNWNHSERVASSMEDNSEAVAPLYLLIKDHKGWSEGDNEPPPSRPVCSGNGGVNKHLSEIVSYMLVPLAHSMDGAEIDSTGSMLEKIEKLNNKLSKGQIDEIPDMKEQMNCCGVMTETKRFNMDLKEKRIERLRNIKIKDTVIPKLKGKLWATRIIDEKGRKGDGIHLMERKEEKCFLPPLQKERKED